MNLTNLALTGINVAQNRLQTAGHNINNAATDGYNRQSVVVSTAGAQSTAAGWVGMGVTANTTQRAYNDFLFRQLVQAQTAEASLLAYGNEITQINNLFTDRTVGISPALQQFFDGIQAVASAPADPAARQELLGRASSLVGQINNAQAFLEAQRNNVNTQITTTVSQINSQVQRIHDLNQQIIVARASSSHQPNDLLDQRDQLLADLGQLVGVNVINQDGHVNLTIGNGQVLLGGNTVFPLHVVPAAHDPSRLVVAYSSPAGSGQLVPLELQESVISGGSLGGLFAYRSEVLDDVQNDLGRLAAGLAIAVNRQHTEGFDSSGQPGTAFFSLTEPRVLAAPGNHGGAALDVRYHIPAIGSPVELTGHDYRVTFDGNAYTVFNTTTQIELMQSPAMPIQVDGLEFSINGVPQANDSWVIQPVRDAAGSLTLALSSTSQIAAAATSAGDADGGNALSLAQLQTQKLLGNGTASLNEAYSQIVNKVAVLTQKNVTTAKAQASLVQQNFAAQQAISGVNLDEEYINLERYQEQFRAAARLVDVSQTLFDTLLGLGR